MKTQKYRCCLVLAGGGFRFAYYLGVHAAAEESGRRPDVLLASCGGSIAAAVIACLPNADARLDWLRSPDMYKFLRDIRPTNRATVLRALSGAVKRWLNRSAAPRIVDLFQDYLFDLPAAPPLPAGLPACGPALAIVGGRLLYLHDEVGRDRDGRQLFAQVVFCPARAAALLHGTAAPAADARWSGGAVATTLELDCTMPLADAVRISIADMFYFSSHTCAGQHYTGGVIDLFPIELAQRLASEVIMERKSSFNPWLALPALRAVLGIDGGARLRHVHTCPAAAWFDTRDMSHALHTQGISKRIRWRENRVGLDVPPTYAAYADLVRAQWEYGYQKGKAAFTGAMP